MSYRQDPDLEFLKSVPSEDLNDLVYCLTHDKDGGLRMHEELTSTEAYKTHQPDHAQYWELIAAEIQCFGANTLATLARGGKGVLYKEVLTDVCDKLKVNYNADSAVERIESNLLMKILSDALERMTPEELQNLAQAAGLNNISGITPGSLTAAFLAIFRMGGFKSYQLTLIIANAILKAIIGRGLSFGANAGLTRALGVLTGPIGWVIAGAWTIVDIAGPAYRVTIPAVIQVAVLRQKQLYGHLAEDVEFS